MMAQLRLLKRMQDWQLQDGESRAVDDLELVQSIQHDIENLLNTIQGTALIDERLGLSDVKKLFVSHGSLAQDVITEEIRHNIDTFEPRVRRFNLEKDSDETTGSIRWRLHGEIPVRDRVIPFQSDITLTADGRISVTARG